MELQEEVSKKDINKNLKWYAIKVVPGTEKKTITFIETQQKKYEGIGDSLSPVEKIYKKVGKKHVVKEKTLIPGYVFLEADITKLGILGVIKSIPTVLSFLGGKTPSPLSIEEIERMSGKKIDSPQVTWKINDWCFLNDGPFKGFKGQIDHIIGEKIIVNVMIFGRETKVETTLLSIDRIVS